MKSTARFLLKYNSVDDELSPFSQFSITLQKNYLVSKNNSSPQKFRNEH